jgi:hypothetical protein
LPAVKNGGFVHLYSARISPSARIAEDVEYDTLIERMCEYTLRAAFARATDDYDWEQDELRRKGLRVVEFLHDGRAIWQDRAAFEQSLAEARTAAIPGFGERNELDPELPERVDRDLRERLRRAGYLVPSLALDMKRLFAELEADVIDCTLKARERLLNHLLRTSAQPENPLGGQVG